MDTIRSEERGVTEIGWLHSRHSFSFGNYYNPEHMNFRTLRVINDDVIEPGQGFNMHPHRDMEIISLVLDGALEHRDSMGNGETLRPGEVQVMSAGRGIQHSEFNPSRTERTHLLQIWIVPDRRGLPPSYGQRAFSVEDRLNRLQRVAGAQREMDDGALLVHQDADVYLTRVDPGHSVRHMLNAGRGAWVQVIGGFGSINGANFREGDAAAIEGPADVRLAASGEAAEFLFFDLK